jgi:flagellar biosynthesis chaperone FliJ
MKAFAFDLQRILEFRRQQSGLERSRFQRFLAQFQLWEDEEARADVRRLCVVEGQHLASLASFQRHIERRLQEVDRLKAGLMPQIEQQRLMVIEADRKVKLLERLREQKHREWIARRDKQTDELAADSYVARLSALRRESKVRC